MKNDLCRALAPICLGAIAAASTMGCNDSDSSSIVPATPPPVPSPTARATPTPIPSPQSCGSDSPGAFGACVERARYEADLTAIARPRTVGTAQWQAVQDLCAARFTEYGYDLELQGYGRGVNVIGTLPGTTRADELVVIGAHYDSVQGCDGADDNASGTAALLEAARVLAGQSHARTLVVACWDEEELGKIGSLAWVLRAAGEGAQIAVNLNFEMIGFASDQPNTQAFPAGFQAIFPEAQAAVEAREFRGDFIALIAGDDAAPSTNALLRESRRVGLPAVAIELDAGLRGSPVLSDLRRSDHAMFWAEGYPAIMLTDSANFRNDNYHCVGGPDAVDTLDLDFAVKVTQATTAAAAEALAASEGAFTPDAVTPECDLVGQDCAAGERCVILSVDKVGLRRRCIPTGGDQTEGMPCTRSELGRDDCAAGHFCTFWEVPNPPEGEAQQMRCVKTCDGGEGQCSDDQYCRRIEPYPAAGGCVTACDPFARECGEGRRCSPTSQIIERAERFSCHPHGALAAAGEGCDDSWDCDHGLWCRWPERRCRALCDAEHSCDGGGACSPLDILVGEGLGTCN